MTPWTCRIAVALLLCTATCAQAQKAPAPPEDHGDKVAVMAPVSVNPGEYVLAPDDVIEIAVANHSDLNKLHTIRPDGQITVPEVGEVRAAGKTPRQLASEIEKSYSATLRNATVSIDVRETHRSVAITSTNNGLHSSGNFVLKPNMRLMDLVTSAGGLMLKPDRYSGKLVRNSSQVIDLDILRATKDPLSEANVPLQANDLVLLEAKQALREDIAVLGQVGHTGQYPLDEQTTVVSLLASAGGTTDGAALKNAYVLRKGEKIPLNLYPAFKEGKSDPAINDFKLLIGDQLIVPQIENRYFVMGQVQKPSYYYIPEKGPINVLEALELAGGQLPTGDLHKASIIREVNGVRKPILVNLDLVQKKPTTAFDIKMQPDDILYVPPRGARGMTFQDVLAPLSALSFLGFRLFN